MEENLTKDDLRQFGLLLMDNIRAIIKEDKENENRLLQSQCLKSKAVRKLLDISAGSVQKLRIQGKVRFTKVLDSYYYNRDDLQKLFDDEKQ
ncbi:DNA-binding protein [Flavobacterium sp. RS13.1]|jgi:acyl-CoA synthetase (NDP forming)|uniref:DNA-binding protein n=1 Tax=Flavobacterium sp. RS13.1 TaxID=3400345 RepID=UPI003AAF3CE7